jgi:hypothetical protein
MMAQPMADAPTPTPNVSTEAVPPRRSGRLFLVLAGLLAGGTVLAALALFRPGNGSAESTAPAATAPTVAAALPAAVAPAPDPMMSQLTALNDQSRSMAATLAALSDKLQHLQADVSAVKDKLDHPAPAAGSQPAASRACPRRVSRSPARVPTLSAARPASRPVARLAADDTRLLSVDTWDNRPSIAWRAGDGGVRFAHDGERTPAGRLEVSPLDPSQSVRIVRPDGTSAVLRTRERP